MAADQDVTALALQKLKLLASFRDAFAPVAIPQVTISKAETLLALMEQLQRERYEAERKMRSLVADHYYHHK